MEKVRDLSFAFSIYNDMNNKKEVKSLNKCNVSTNKEFMNMDGDIILDRIPKWFPGLIESEPQLDDKEKHVHIPLFVIQSFKSRENTNALENRANRKQEFSGWRSSLKKEIEHRLQEVQNTLSVIDQHVKEGFINEQ